MLALKTQICSNGIDTKGNDLCITQISCLISPASSGWVNTKNAHSAESSPEKMHKTHLYTLQSTGWHLWSLPILQATLIHGSKSSPQSNCIFTIVSVCTSWPLNVCKIIPLFLLGSNVFICNVLLSFWMQVSISIFFWGSAFLYSLASLRNAEATFQPKWLGTCFKIEG